MPQIQRQISIEEISSKLKPILGNKIDELYFRYSLSESLEEKNQILQILSVLYQKHLGKFLDKKMLLEPPQQNLVSGEYDIANVVYANKELFPFALREKDWPRHVCISGMSGSGKTTLALNILKKFIEKEKPFLVFDWKKSFRPLLNIDPSIMVFTVGNDAVSNLFKTNINIPPKGVAPKEWINTLCDLLTESFCVSFGVHKILLETLDEVFEGWEVYKGSKHYPNWQHIKRMLEIKAREAKGRESTWYESALRIASVLTFGDFGKVINYDGKRSLSVEDLFDKQVIFELNSLGVVEKKFFAEYLLTYIYKLKKANQRKSDEGFKNAIVVDEAHNIFLKNKTYFVTESVTDMVYREMREYGTCLICLDQHLSKLSDSVKGNSACHIAFQQQLPQDVMDISSLMNLADKKEVFTELPVGYAIVKLSERYTSPFLVKAPYNSLRDSILSDEKIASKMDCVVRGIEVEKNDPEFKNALIEKTEATLELKMPEIPQKTEENDEKSVNVKTINKTNLEKQSEIPPQITGNNHSILTKTQKVLYDFVCKQISQGRTIKEAEKLLEKGLPEKLYREADVWVAVNYFLEKALTKEDYLAALKKKNEIKQTVNDESQLVNEVQIIVESPAITVNTANPVNQANEILIDNKPSLKKSTLNSPEEERFVTFLIDNPNHTLSTVEIYRKIGVSPRKGNVVKNKLLENGIIKVKEERSTDGWKKIIKLNSKVNLN